MKIAFSGAQGTGKTTLISLLRQDERFSKGFEFCTNTTRKVKESGLKINENGDDSTQIMMIDYHKSYLSENTNSIIDRCLLDVLVYTEYLYRRKKVSLDTLRYALKSFGENITKYDVIFYIEPEFDIVDDSVRSLDKSFRDEIVDIFIMYLDEYKIPVVHLTGTVEERLKQINDALREEKYERF